MASLTINNNHGHLTSPHLLAMINDTKIIFTSPLPFIDTNTATNAATNNINIFNTVASAVIVIHSTSITNISSDLAMMTRIGRRRRNALRCWVSKKDTTSCGSFGRVQHAHRFACHGTLVSEIEGGGVGD